MTVITGGVLAHGETEDDIFFDAEEYTFYDAEVNSQ
jgi:hypothetical protein